MLRTCLLSLFIVPILSAQNGLHFDGVDDKVDCGLASAVQITGNTITLEAWIKADSWTNNVWEGNIINKEQNTGTSGGYMLRVGDGGKLNMNLGDGNWNELTTPNAVLTLNTWHHVAGTYDGTEMKLYVDGVAVDSVNYSITISNSTAPLLLGAHSIWNRFFVGAIDEVRIWDVAKTAAELQQNMHTLQCADATGLRAYYRFDQGIAGGANSGLTTLWDSKGTSNGSLQTFALSGTTSNWIGSSPSFTAQYQNYMQVDTICSGEQVLFGSQTLSAAGTYTDTIPSLLSCDSLITLTLAVKSINNTISFVNDTLKASNPNLTYHWIDCNNQNRIIPGATNQYYVPFVNTNYAVIVSDGDCIDTSNCLNINIGLDEFESNGLKIYPIPFNDVLIVNSENFGNVETLIIYNVEGKIVKTLSLANETQARVNTEKLPVGVYYLEIKNQKAIKSRKKLLKL